MENNVVITLFKKAGLSLEKINQLSVQTGFIKRFRQIKAAEFLVYMIVESIRGCVSCNDLAAVIRGTHRHHGQPSGISSKNELCLSAVF